MADFKSQVALGILLSSIVGVSYIAYDILFSAPDHLQGTIIEKIFIPAHNVTAATPYSGVRRSTYSISVQKEEQWIAIVKMENGDTVQVHCKASHYKLKNEGDMLHFKKFEGKHFHIKYFAHREEED